VRQAEKTLDKSSNLCYIVSKYKLYIDNIYTMSQEENMPRGRRRHGGCGQGRFAGGTIRRFLEPVLLLLLHRGDGHGDELVSGKEG
jgi:hypothetical protein